MRIWQGSWLSIAQPVVTAVLFITLLMTFLSKHFQTLAKHDFCSSNLMQVSLFPEQLESTEILILDFNIILGFSTAFFENV